MILRSSPIRRFNKSTIIINLFLKSSISLKRSQSPLKINNLPIIIIRSSPERPEIYPTHHNIVRTPQLHPHLLATFPQYHLISSVLRVLLRIKLSSIKWSQSVYWRVQGIQVLWKRCYISLHLDYTRWNKFLFPIEKWDFLSKTGLWHGKTALTLANTL